MKTGRTLTQLAEELTRQKDARRDYLASTAGLSVATGESNTNLTMGDKVLPINDWAHGQIASHIGVPKTYYDKLRASKDAALENLFDHTVNTLFKHDPEKRFIRTLDGKVRSFHSPKFRAFDNYELAEAILPALPKAEAEVVSCEVTDKRLYLKVISPKVTYEIAKGDVVQAGLVITNSEIGASSLKVEPLIYRLVCTNGMISEDTSFRRNHVGKRLESGASAGAIEFFSDATRAQSDKAVFMQIADIARATLSDAGFRQIAQKFAAAKEDAILKDPFEVVEVTQTKFGLSDHEKQGVLQHLLAGGDLNRFGLINAVTRYSQDVADYDKATDFERLGGTILELNRKQWQEIAH